ncbi:MAG: hypothetical protein K0S76_899 [Herbinix sp.]|jgi:hypothetical protein|nr:hypothetical protein [Herbinix sp.]
MPKKSRLGDDAELYQPRKNQTEREKLKEMPMKKRLSYLWEYYRVPALVTTVSVLLVVYILYAVFGPKTDTRFNAMFLQNTINEELLSEYKTDFAEHLKIDFEKEDIIFNSTFYDIDSMWTAINAQAAAGEIDVMIVPESRFLSIAQSGFFDKLSDQLPTDLYSSLTSHFYITDTADDEVKSAYGIYLTDTELFKNNAFNEDPYVLGIVVNSEHKENAVEFIRYLYNLFP